MHRLSFVWYGDSQWTGLWWSLLLLHKTPVSNCLYLIIYFCILLTSFPHFLYSSPFHSLYFSHSFIPYIYFSYSDVLTTSYPLPVLHPRSIPTIYYSYNLLSAGIQMALLSGSVLMIAMSARLIWTPSS